MENKSCLLPRRKRRLPYKRQKLSSRRSWNSLKTLHNNQKLTRLLNTNLNSNHSLLITIKKKSLQMPNPASQRARASRRNHHLTVLSKKKAKTATKATVTINKVQNNKMKMRPSGSKSIRDKKQPSLIMFCRSLRRFKINLYRRLRSWRGKLSLKHLRAHQECSGLMLNSLILV